MAKPACCSPRVISSRSEAGTGEQAKAHNKAATGTHIPATFMRVTIRL